MQQACSWLAAQAATPQSPFRVVASTSCAKAQLRRKSPSNPPSTISQQHPVAPSPTGCCCMQPHAVAPSPTGCCCMQPPRCSFLAYRVLLYAATTLPPPRCRVAPWCDRATKPTISPFSPIRPISLISGNHSAGRWWRWGARRLRWRWGARRLRWRWGAKFFFAVREIKKGQSHDSPIP